MQLDLNSVLDCVGKLSEKAFDKVCYWWMVEERKLEGDDRLRVSILKNLDSKNRVVFAIHNFMIKDIDADINLRCEALETAIANKELWQPKHPYVSVIAPLVQLAETHLQNLIEKRSEIKQVLNAPYQPTPEDFEAFSQFVLDKRSNAIHAQKSVLILTKKMERNHFERLQGAVPHLIKEIFSNIVQKSEKIVYTDGVEVAQQSMINAWNNITFSDFKNMLSVQTSCAEYLPEPSGDWSSIWSVMRDKKISRFVEQNRSKVANNAKTKPSA